MSPPTAIRCTSRSGRAQVEPRGHVVVLHGVQSHGGWYHRLGRTLSAAGYVTSFPDRRGSVRTSAIAATRPRRRRLIRRLGRMDCRPYAPSGPGLAHRRGRDQLGRQACGHPRSQVPRAGRCHRADLSGPCTLAWVSLPMERLAIAWAFIDQSTEEVPDPVVGSRRFSPTAPRDRPLSPPIRSASHERRLACWPPASGSTGRFANPIEDHAVCPLDAGGPGSHHR